MASWIDGSLYPDTDIPEEISTLEDRVDLLARLCSAWDFGLLPEASMVEEIRRPEWREAVDATRLLTSPAAVGSPPTVDEIGRDHARLMRGEVLDLAEHVNLERRLVAALTRGCERMVVGQRDEIELMRNWLRDRGQKVPDANATHHRMKMNGVEHDMLMPGMLSPAELAQLDKARNAEWDRLFLTFMIRHHEGALKMVDDLFESHGALQDEDMYKFASDMYADQLIEIERMQKMLATTSR